MHLYEGQFGERQDFSRVVQPSKILIIATTPRCGSHMLGHALHETNSFGFPLEYAHPRNLAEWKRRLGVEDFRLVLKEIQRRRTSSNGVFGIKIHYSHIKQFGGFKKLLEYLPDAHYVLLSRGDVLRQAVSWSIASQTGVWISGQKPVKDRPEYDFEHIAERLRQTILQNASWRYLLAANGCNYVEMNFCDVKSNLSQSIQKIADFIDIELDPGRIPETHLTKTQRGDINAEWAIKFISDFGTADGRWRNEDVRFPGL